jgi:sodium-coupled neutral amino acid transporter 11
VGDFEKPAAGRSGVWGAVFNLTNSIIGAGIIGMPFAVKRAGFAAGVFFIVFMAWLTDLSLRVLIRSGELSGRLSYQGMVRTVLGKPGYWVLSVAQFMFPLLGMITYTIVVGQTLPLVFARLFGSDDDSTTTEVKGNGHDFDFDYNGDSDNDGISGFLTKRMHVIVLVTFGVMLPLSLCRTIESLSWWSAVSGVAVLAMMVLIVARGALIAAEDQPVEETVLSAFHPRGCLQAIGVMAFAYVCHHNAFLVHTSLQQRSSETFARVSKYSLLLSCAAALLLGVGGYMAFGQASDANILNNFAANDDWANAARFLFALVVTLTYPIECIVARDVIRRTFLATTTWANSNLVHYGLTLLLCVLSMGTALATSNLGFLLEVNGVVSASTLAFLLPGLAYFALLPGKWYSAGRLKGLLLALFGILVVAVGTSMIIYEQLA